MAKSDCFLQGAPGLEWSNNNYLLPPFGKKMRDWQQPRAWETTARISLEFIDSLRYYLAKMETKLSPRDDRNFICMTMIECTASSRALTQRRCTVTDASLSASTTSVMPWAAFKDSSAQDSSDVEPPSPKTTAEPPSGLTKTISGVLIGNMSSQMIPATI